MSRTGPSAGPAARRQLAQAAAHTMGARAPGQDAACGAALTLADHATSADELAYLLEMCGLLETTP